MKLEYEKLLSNFAFEFNLRRYNEAALRGLLNLSILAPNQEAIAKGHPGPGRWQAPGAHSDEALHPGPSPRLFMSIYPYRFEWLFWMTLPPGLLLLLRTNLSFTELQAAGPGRSYPPRHQHAFRTLGS